jgi:hypothetical protein
VATAHKQHDTELETLKAVYDRLGKERDRLRDARGYFARGLGPAPASAGIATALVAAIGESDDTVALAVAVVLVGIMILVSTVYDGKPAYRHLYARRLSRTRTDLLAPDTLPPSEWYRKMIELERDIYGWPPRQNNHYFLPFKKVNNLQDGLDSERTGRIVVAALWVVVVLVLVIAAVH